MSDVTQQPAVIETVDKVEAQANIDVPSDPEPIQEENKEDPKETFQQEATNFVLSASNSTLHFFLSIFNLVVFELIL